jgi:hypothetical protein
LKKVSNNVFPDVCRFVFQAALVHD